MSKYWGLIEVCLEAEDETSAVERLRAIAQTMETETHNVLQAIESNDVEEVYE